MIIKSFKLFESKLEYLSSFSNILKSMDSSIAKILLNMRDLDLDLTANFIGVVGEDIASFVPDKKSQDVKRVYEVVSRDGFFPHRSGYDGFFNACGLPNCVSPNIGDKIYEFNNLDSKLVFKFYPNWGSDWALKHYKDAGLDVDFIEFNPNKNYKSYVETEDIVTNSKFQQIKIGRLVRSLTKLSGNKVTDKEVEIFVNEFKSKYEFFRNSFRNFKLVSGDEIKYWYSSDNYSDGRSTLHNSCMRYPECQNYFGIYVENPQVCQLLIHKKDFEENKITGRAIVWKLDNGDTFMDRIYYSKDSEVGLFIEYAKSNGWAYKSNQSVDGDVFLNGSLYSKDLTVKLKNFNFKYYPYLDTISYLSSNGILSKDKIEKRSKRLRSAEGGIEGCECSDGYVDCTTCDGGGKYDCNRCDGEGSIECSDCGGSGEYECNYCEGSGKIEDLVCKDCNGSGSTNCSACDNEPIECSDCGGSGEIECEDCSGRGSVECENCE